MDTKTILAGLILTMAAAGVLIPTSNADIKGNHEYTFDPALHIWANAAGSQIDAKSLTCNYSKISDISTMVQSGQYAGTVYVRPNQAVIISVTGGATTLYQVSIDGNSKAIIKEVK